MGQIKTVKKSSFLKEISALKWMACLPYILIPYPAPKAGPLAGTAGVEPDGKSEIAKKKKHKKADLIHGVTI